MNQEVGCYSSDAFQDLLGRCLFLETVIHCPVTGQRCRNPGPATGFIMNSTLFCGHCLSTSLLQCAWPGRVSTCLLGKAGLWVESKIVNSNFWSQFGSTDCKIWNFIFAREDVFVSVKFLDIANLRLLSILVGIFWITVVDMSLVYKCARTPVCRRGSWEEGFLFCPSAFTRPPWLMWSPVAVLFSFLHVECLMVIVFLSWSPVRLSTLAIFYSQNIFW